MTRAATAFRNACHALLVGCLVLLTPAWSQSPSEPAIDADLRERWGILAEMAERDFEAKGGNGYWAATVRWEVPGRVLLQAGWNSGSQREAKRFTLDEANGVINVDFFWEGRPLDRNPMGTMTVESDGSVRITRIPPASRHLVDRRIYRDPEDGRYVETNPGDTWRYRPIESASGRIRRHVENLQARGIVSRPRPELNQQTRLASADGASSGDGTGSPPQPTTVGSAVLPRPAETISLPAPSGPRFALVIGNGSYGPAMGRLPNPVNDAELIAQSLRAAGFDVDVITDADQRAMKRAIQRLGERMAEGGPGSTGLFFYAGHGVQSRGVNYLIPIGAQIEREADVDLEGVSADSVLRQMEEAGVSTNIVILDACRNMPLARSFRSGARGLARMDAPNGSFIAYSTAPGSVARDGEGPNSPFAAALAARILQRGEPIEITFREVRRAVLNSTEGDQTPWDSSSLVDTFMFRP